MLDAKVPAIESLVVPCDIPLINSYGFLLNLFFLVVGAEHL